MGFNLDLELISEDVSTQTSGNNFITEDGDVVKWEAETLGDDGFDLVDSLVVLSLDEVKLGNANGDFDVVEETAEGATTVSCFTNFTAEIFVEFSLTEAVFDVLLVECLLLH